MSLWIYRMSSAATQTHMCIYMVLYYRQKWAHATQTTLCFFLLFSFLSSVTHVCADHLYQREDSSAEHGANQFLFSSLTDLEPCPLEAFAWTSSLPSVRHCASILYLASLPSSRMALLISLLLQKAICFMLSNLQTLARVWKETFTNYVEPTTRIPGMATTEEISKVEQRLLRSQHSGFTRNHIGDGLMQESAHPESSIELMIFLAVFLLL